MFEIKCKVAIITGGASGVGLSIAKELLRNGLKGVTLVDVNENSGKNALFEIQKHFGNGKAIFVKANIVLKEEFEVAFTRTLEEFQNIDILFNNAGIYNDLNWEKEVDINIKGTINGIILGLETYLKKYKQGSEAVILNTSSIAAIRPGPWMPIYGATKSAIASATQSWGHTFHYERTKVRVVALCPGGTDTPLFDNENYSLKPEYILANEVSTELSGKKHRQSSDFVSKEALKILKNAENGSLWIVESGQPAYQYLLPDRNNFKTNSLKETQN